jgi:hypothetical protein
VLNALKFLSDRAQTPLLIRHTREDTNMRWICRRAVVSLAASIAVCGSTFALVGSATPVFAGCTPESGVGVDTNVPNTIGKATSLHSDWLTGPGTIAYSKATTISVGATVSGDLSGSVGILVADAKVQFGLALTVGYSQTATWTYTLNVAAGKTAFVQQYHEALKTTVGKWSQTSACKYYWTDLQYLYAPYSSTGSGTYLYALAYSGPPGPNVSWP